MKNKSKGNQVEQILAIHNNNTSQSQLSRTGLGKTVLGEKKILQQRSSFSLEFCQYKHYQHNIPVFFKVIWDFY